MQNQRKLFAKYYGKGSQLFVAEFDHLTHKINEKKQKVPVILLKNISLKNNQHSKVDHCWVKMTKPWFELPQELLPGDVVSFQGSVKKYRINRQDVLNKRSRIGKNALRKNDQIFKNWLRYTKNHKRKNYALSLKRMKQKQKENINKAQTKQKNYELVDFTLNKISKIKIIKRTNTKMKREKYSYWQFKNQGYRYTAWLAARSFSFLKKYNS